MGSLLCLFLWGAQRFARKDWLGQRAKKPKTHAFILGSEVASSCGVDLSKLLSRGRCFGVLRHYCAGLSVVLAKRMMTQAYISTPPESTECTFCHLCTHVSVAMRKNKMKAPLLSSLVECGSPLTGWCVCATPPVLALFFKARPSYTQNPDTVNALYAGPVDGANCPVGYSRTV